jgi:hypothetical protein
MKGLIQFNYLNFIHWNLFERVRDSSNGDSEQVQAISDDTEAAAEPNRVAVPGG